MKSEKEKLAAKSVEQLKAAYKRMGGKLVNPDGKAKTKQSLINGIVMKNRLAGKSMGGNSKTTKAKLTAVKIKSIDTGAFKRIHNAANDVQRFLDAKKYAAARKKLEEQLKMLNTEIAKTLK